MEGGRVLGIAGNIKFAPVRSNEGILSHKPAWREAEVELGEDVAEGFREELGPLLDEGRSRGDLLGKEIKIFEQFMADTAAPHAEKEMDDLDKVQLAATGKILFRVFDERGSVAGHGIHNCPESGLDLLRERHIGTSLKLK